eukprot:760167-Hanusia_phi.AAC.2
MSLERRPQSRPLTLSHPPSINVPLNPTTFPGLLPRHRWKQRQTLSPRSLSDCCSATQSLIGHPLLLLCSFSFPFPVSEGACFVGYRKQTFLSQRVVFLPGRRSEDLLSVE